MEFLRKIRRNSTIAGVTLLIAGIVVFFIPGCLSLLRGDSGAVLGVIQLLCSIFLIVLSIKAISGRQGERRFLDEVDKIGTRAGVLAAIDGTRPLDGVVGSDVRLHPSFIAIRTGNVANAWRGDAIVWIYQKDNVITSKTKACGITISKSTNMQYAIEIWNNDRKEIILAALSEDVRNRIMARLKLTYPNAVYGFSDALQAAYDRNPQLLVQSGEKKAETIQRGKPFSNGSGNGSTDSGDAGAASAPKRDGQFLRYLKMRPEEWPIGIEAQPGATPSGGYFSVAIYSDKNHIPCKKEHAYYMEIHECDERGNSIARTYGHLGHNRD